MISKETYNKLQEYKKMDVSILKVSQKLGISYNTAYKWWNKSDEEFETFQKEHEFVLDNYRQYIIQQLKLCPQINHTLILRRLKEEFPDFEIPTSTFFRYMKKLREQTGIQKPTRKGAIRDEVKPGYEGQADYGQYVMKSMYGNNVRVYFFCMVLSYSRMKFAYFSTEPFNAAKTIEAHKYAFKYFGGRPQMIVYDQDKILVVSENMGEVIFVKEFEEYVKETGFSVYLCKRWDPQSKGRIEKVVDTVKHDFLDGRIYCGIDSLNKECMEWLDGSGNGIVHSYTKKIPRELFRSECGKLIKVHEKRNTDVLVTTPHNTVIEYLNNFYKLPEDAIPNDERVRVERYDKVLLIYHALTNDLICKFNIPEGVGNVVSLPKEERVLSIEQELHEYYADDEVAIEFLKELRKQKPRYVYAQCDRIRRMQKYYTEEQIRIGMQHCNLVGICTVMELSSFLLYRFGEETARRYLHHSSYKTYLLRANEIREEQNNG